jgi:hypothetical protein
MSNAYCKKCKQIEPDWWCLYRDGLWTCKCKSNETKKVDKALKKLDKKIKKLLDRK